MAHTDPESAFDDIEHNVSKALTSVFPIKGRERSLELEAVHIERSKLDPKDLASQYEARVQGGSWTVPVKGTVVLKDKTGQVVGRSQVHLMDLPRMTDRLSFIHKGQEYQVTSQWQLKTGAYTRRRQNGELETRFNVAGRSAFDLTFDPETKLFQIEYKKSNLPALPILQAMGVSTEELQKAWGKDIYEANASSRRNATALAQFHRTSTNGGPPSTHKEAVDNLRKVMEASKMRPEVTEQTLGARFEHVTGDALALASRKLLKVYNGAPEDDRDANLFKTLRTTGEFLHDQIKQSAPKVTLQVQRQLNRPEGVTARNAFTPGLMNSAVSKLFESSLANPAKQINPLDMISSAMSTTIMGPGGIKSDVQVTDEAKMVHPSQFGFVDPLATPEGASTGVVLRLPLGAKKIGEQPHIPLFNLKTGKQEWVDPIKAYNAKVVLADQVEFKGGKAHALHEKVKVMGKENRLETMPLHEADYVLPHASQVFNLTSAMVPFVDSDSGNRVSMAVRHLEQSISLRDRQKPLVQVESPTGDTFEKLVGHQVAHTSPVDGVVKSVTSKAITVEGADGKLHRVQLYDHYPLNDAKSVLHSTPTVKPGDKVSKGGLVADNNYTKDGHLALGTTLRVAYMPFQGKNFEDSVVITRSAAEKLTSQHLHKHDLPVSEDTVLGKKTFITQNPGAFDQKQLAVLDDNGVVKVGQKVRPGDPLILAMQPYSIKDRVGLGALRKSLTNQHVDKALRWDSDHEGEVVAVHRTKEGYQVHVRTFEPMQVADKISNRHGGKGVVGYIIEDHEAPRDKDGKPVDILFNPTGVGGRMNVGQILETMAGKIAQKTGQTYVVKNFDPKVPDRVEHMKSELKKHGLKDTEELFDPKTGLSYGAVLTGPQMFEKLVHQAEKKISVRSGMSLPKLQSTERYDSMTFQPSGGDGTGGQSYGQLGIYALLAHGANNILREAMTLKSQGEDPETNETKRWKTGHAEAWMAMQKGLPLPPPRPTFAFHRFTELLRAAGVNVEKKGSELMLSPMTDKQVLAMSKGEVVNPVFAVQSKIDPELNHYKPIPGGLFDTKITGGHGGTNWSHISLAEPIPNPLFEDPIKKLTGLTAPKFDGILQGTLRVDPATGKVVDKGGVTGGEGIKALLKLIDVNKELEATKRALKGAPPAAVDTLYKKARYLGALKKMELRPEDAYVLHHIPVLPPKLRPLSIMDSGTLRYEDMNGLYMHLGQANETLKTPQLKGLPDAEKAELRKNLYESISTLFGSTALPEGAKQKGVLHQIAGTSPKLGLFQKGLLSPRQDATMRAVIIPGPDLHLDQVGLPKKEALTQFRPYVIKNLVQMGAAKTVLDAQALLAEHESGRKQDPSVWHALERAVDERPVLIKRDPALHKESIMAFKAVLIPGSSIKLHPLVTGGFNADHDGDSVEGEVLVVQELGESRVAAVDLKDFPRLEDSRTTRGHIDTYNVPPGVHVFGVIDGKLQACQVLEYSVHKDLPVWEVKTHTGEVLRCSGDHSLAVLNPMTLQIERKKPSEALGGALPTMGLLAESLTDKVHLNGVDHDATPELAEELATLWCEQKIDGAQFVAVESSACKLSDIKGWVSALPDLLRQMLLLPLAFRRRFLSAVFSRGMRDKQAVVQMNSDAVADMVRLALSCGVNARPFAYNRVVFCAKTLQKATWFKPKWSKKRLNSRIVERIPVPAWVTEELQIVAHPKPVNWLDRTYVERALARHTTSSPSTFLRAWQALVLDSGLRWAEVTSAQETGETRTLYDLSVLGSLNFMMASGTIVWDTMSVYLPADQKAVDEAYRMLPSKNIFNEATLNPSHVPTMESRLGLHRLSLVGPGTGKSFSTEKDAANAAAQGKLHVNEPFTLAGKTTTVGRLLLSQQVPDALKGRIRHDFKMELSGKGLKSLFEEVGRNHTKEYVPFVDGLKNLGNAASTGIIHTNLTQHGAIPIGAHSFRLDDFTTDRSTRDPLLAKAKQEVEHIAKLNISQAEKDRRTVDSYLSAFQNIAKIHHEREAQELDRNRLYAMSLAGVKPSKDQYNQMRIAPGIMKDSKGNLIPEPIQHSYGEGLKLHEYWIGAFGARSGAVKKVQEVQEPGYMTKLLQNTSMALLIDRHDCGTNEGRKMSIQHADLVDRHLSHDLKVGSLHLPAGTLLSKDKVDQIRSLDPKAEVLVRSPLHCHSEKGICQKCFGLAANGRHHDIGTNIGVLSAHALGERAVQLTLKAFHTGGSVSSRAGGALGAFQRLEQLTYLPDKTPNSASLATKEGTITKIVPTSTGTEIHIDGVPHFVGKDAEGRPLHQNLTDADRAPGYKAWSPPTVGMKVHRGFQLSDPNRTLINPHRLYEATGDMNKVRHFMADELHGIYADEGVRKRAVETVVRAMGNVTKIDDPKDQEDLLRGQFYSHSSINRINTERVKQGKLPVEHKPVLMGVNLLPLAANEDWMAVLNHQKLRGTLKQNAALGAVSHLHGYHPVPGLAYGAEFGKPLPGSKSPY